MRAAESGGVAAAPTAPVIGVDCGCGDPLDAEGLIAASHQALLEAGLGHMAWVTTHTVSTAEGPHTAFAVVLPSAAGRPAREVAELVGAAFDKGLALARTAAETDPGHVHAVDAPTVWVDGVVAGSQARRDGARQAAAAYLAGLEGRAVVFPTSETLTGAVPVERVHDTVIEEVVSLGPPLLPDTVLDTRDFVRPRRDRGRWVLHVMPAADGTVVPFEEPRPMRCCQDKLTGPRCR